MAKKFYEIYNGRKWGVGDFVCAVEDEDVANELCKLHPKWFKLERIIEDKKKNEN